MAYIQHRVPCCRTTWEQKHQKNQQEEETSIPNNVIKYTASQKLVETDSVPSYPNSSSGLRTTQFNTTITSHTFENGIGTITFEEDVTEIKSWAFYNNGNITSIMIPNSMAIIGQSAFQSCTSLTSVTIPNNVTSIGGWAFQNCSGLTSVTIPNSVTSIGDGTFINCRSLTSVTIPNSVTSIGNSVFNACSSLISVTIGNSVTSIGYEAFNDCSGLVSIISLATTAPTIQQLTFLNVGSNGTLFTPLGSTGYDTWMSTGDYYLGKYNWTKIEQ